MNEYYVIGDGELLEIIEEKPDLQALADEHGKPVWVIRGETIGEASPRPARSDTMRALKEQVAKLQKPKRKLRYAGQVDEKERMRQWNEMVEGMVE